MEVFIENHWQTQTVEVFVKEERGNVDSYLHYNGENIICTTFNRSDPTVKNIKPFMVIPMQYFECLLVAFVNEGKKRNIKTENENHLKGKLEATETHLSDMREFSKKLLEMNNELKKLDFTNKTE